MVKEHYLDGKIIDPKRAIPRDEQERTSKIFVGGVSQDANEQDFKKFFMQFGRVVDATLMIDKDTGRPRGFGFVTFDSEAAVEACLSQPLEILGKPIEVKKAQPRGNLRDEDDRRLRARGFQGDRFKDEKSGSTDVSQQGAQGQTNLANTMTPQMMAQYWQRMQQYFAMMQQQMALAAAQGQGMAGAAAMGGMNPAMAQQMQQLKQMQQMNPMARGPTTRSSHEPASSRRSSTRNAGDDEPNDDATDATNATNATITANATDAKSTSRWTWVRWAWNGRSDVWR
ncbi:DAZ-associated protein 1 [Coccidioides immitis H538.4]|uniref:DAZ-associated protein 1 n=1 Tax=Coccidioides immitis H538.4 TaxID=396776 RepID=A0A0J8RHE0_COCIT|nr:DAZ-associated protein 1 [Coccidioides immitis H538.4]